MSPKELTKLAAACRKAGIKSFKNAEIEFTLTDEAPVSNYKKKQEPLQLANNYLVETDSLTEEQLLMWSVTGADGASGEGQ